MDNEQEGRLEASTGRKAVHGEVPLSKIKAPDSFWGAGMEPHVLLWLRENYNPATMPTLQVATVQGETDGMYTLLGWNHEGTAYGPLLHEIFGDEYAEAVLTRVRMGKQLPAEREEPLDGSHRNARG